MKTLLDRDEIENKITNYEAQFFTQLAEIKLYESKTHEKLSELVTWNKTLAGTLRYEYDNEDTCAFLKLLKNYRISWIVGLTK